MSAVTVERTRVQLLNASYEPLGTVELPQAVRMLLRDVALIEEADPVRRLGALPAPRVIRLVRYVPPKWLYRPARWHRGGIFIRDRHRCAYCGRTAKTIDHLVPRARGGEWSWSNCVAACAICNESKGNRTPREARMPLRYATPYVPTVAQLRALARAGAVH